MLFDFPPFSIIFIITGILGLIYAIVFLFRPAGPGKIPFVFLLIAGAWWAICRSFEAGGVDIATKIFWGKMEYFGIVNTGVMWLAFALDFTGSEWWKRPRNLVLLFIIPVITLVAAWTNQWHGLIWSDIYFSPDSPLVLVWEHNIGFWIYDTYAYIVIIAGIFILCRAAVKSRGILRRQLITVLAGFIIPVAGNIVYICGLSPVKGLDLTPFALLITGAFYAVTIFRLRFMDIIPVARVTLVESMPDGILVIDNDDHVVYINPAAAGILGVDKQQVEGKRLDAVCPKLDMIDPSGMPAINTEIFLENSGPTIYLDISVTAIRDSKNKNNGRLVVMRNITGRRVMEQTLRESESRYSTLVEQSNNPKGRVPRAEPVGE
ncbi:MAG: PAS domain S-box protein [Dehalococcoidales bacterium]|nr:PAS domain S-box protein [Dehalococcoidales bacterium]